MGRFKLIESPEKLWEIFEAYCKETKSNPFKVQDYVGKDAEMVFREKERPLTMEGFEMYCFKEGIINDLGDYFSNKKDNYSEFSTICSHIKKSIRQNQIEGGMVGIFNPSITQRLNNLTEKQETTVKADKPLIIDWSGNYNPNAQTEGSGNDSQK